MAGQMFMIVDSVNTSAVIQPGQPPTTVAAYVLDVPDGQSMEDVANAFFVDKRFPLNSAIYLVDALNVAAYVALPQLIPAPALTGSSDSVLAGDSVDIADSVTAAVEESDSALAADDAVAVADSAEVLPE